MKLVATVVVALAIAGCGQTDVAAVEQIRLDHASVVDARQRYCREVRLQSRPLRPGEYRIDDLRPQLRQAYRAAAIQYNATRGTQEVPGLPIRVPLQPRC